MKKNTFLKIIIGFILVHLDIRIGQFDLLPNFAGYALILSSIYDFMKLSSGFRKFVIPCIILLVYHAILWIVPLSIPYLAYLVSAVSILFWFMFLTGIAALLRQFKQAKDANTLIGLRNLYTAFQLGFILTTNIFYVPLFSYGLAMLSIVLYIVIPFMLAKFSQNFE